MSVSQEISFPFYIRMNYLQLLNVCDALLLHTDVLSSAPFIAAFMSFCVEAKAAHASYALGTHQTRQDLIRAKCNIIIVWRNFSLAFMGVEVDQAIV